MHGVYFNLESECDNIRFLLFENEQAALEWMYQWLRDNGHVEEGQEPGDSLESFQNDLGMMEYFHDYPVVDMRQPCGVRESEAKS